MRRGAAFLLVGLAPFLPPVLRRFAAPPPVSGRPPSFLAFLVP